MRAGAYERLWVALVKCARCHITANPDDPERFFIVSSGGDRRSGTGGRRMLGARYFNQAPLPVGRPSRPSLMRCHRDAAVSSSASRIILYLWLDAAIVILYQRGRVIGWLVGQTLSPEGGLQWWNWKYVNMNRTLRQMFRIPQAIINRWVLLVFRSPCALKPAEHLIQWSMRQNISDSSRAHRLLLFDIHETWT